MTPRAEDLDADMYRVEQFFDLLQRGQVLERDFIFWATWFDSLPSAGPYLRYLCEYKIDVPIWGQKSDIRRVVRDKRPNNHKNRWKRQRL